MTDSLRRGIAGDYRVAIATTTDLVREAAIRHLLPGTAAVAMARALTGLALAAITDKEWRRFSAQWMGRGPFGSLHVDLQRPGNLRGYLTGDGVAAEVADGFGRGGLLSVIRQQHDGRFVQGQVALSVRTVDEDLERYLEQSEQVASTLRVLVELEDGMPTAVTGVLIQPLPGGSASGLRKLVGTDLLDRRASASLPPDALLDAVAPDLPAVDWLLEVPLGWACPCSRERIASGIRLLGREDLDDMVAKQEGTEVRCDFCADEYVFTPDDIRGIREALDRAD